MNRKLKAAFAVMLSLIIFSAAYALWQTTITVPSRAIVKSYGVSAWESNGVTPLSEIDWNMVEPNSSYVRTIYLKNDGNVDVQLSMATANWNPNNASSYMSLTWNREGSTLNASESTPADLTLSVAANVNGIETVSFDIIITATET